MAATYKGGAVTILRPATKEDYQFRDDLGEQVLIRMTDGIECVVPMSDVSENDRNVDPTVGVMAKEATREVSVEAKVEEEDTSDHEPILPKHGPATWAALPPVKEKKTAKVAKKKKR